MPISAKNCLRGEKGCVARKEHKKSLSWKIFNPKKTAIIIHIDYLERMVMGHLIINLFIMLFSLFFMNKIMLSEIKL